MTPLAVCSHSRYCSSSARATEQRLAGRRAAIGARLKPDVRRHKPLGPTQEWYSQHESRYRYGH